MSRHPRALFCSEHVKGFAFVDALGKVVNVGGYCAIEHHDARSSP